MAACGFWLSTDRLVAVVVDDDAPPAPTLRAAMNDDERWAMLDFVTTSVALTAASTISANSPCCSPPIDDPL